MDEGWTYDPITITQGDLAMDEKWTYDPITITAKPTQSRALNAQRAGRSYRTYPGRDGGQPTRNIDGSPETAAQLRYFALRESGYDGWIDQDGYAADGPTWLDRDGNVHDGFGPADCAVDEP